MKIAHRLRHFAAHLQSSAQSLFSSASPSSSSEDTPTTTSEGAPENAVVATKVGKPKRSAVEEIRHILGRLHQEGGWEDIMGADFVLESLLRANPLSANHPVLRDFWSLPSAGEIQAGIMHKLAFRFPDLTSQHLLRLLETGPDLEAARRVVRHPAANAQVWKRAVELHPQHLALAGPLSEIPAAVKLSEVRMFIRDSAARDPAHLPALVRISEGDDFLRLMRDLIVLRPREAANLLAALPPSPRHQVDRESLALLMAAEDPDVRLQATRLLAHLHEEPVKPGISEQTASTARSRSR